MTRPIGRRIANARKAGRLVDVYSDASKVHGTGAWAMVAVREGEDPVEASGPLRDFLDSSTLGELRAAANAIHAARRAGAIRDGDLAVVRCDCTGAVRRITGAIENKRKADPELGKVVDWLRAFAQAEGFSVTAAWVKGHQPPTSTDPHAPHNRRCDELCGYITGTRKTPEQVKADQIRHVEASRKRARLARSAAVTGAAAERRAKLERAMIRAGELAGGEA